MLSPSKKGITDEPASEQQQLVFFNYHEIPTASYRAAASQSTDIHQKQLIITHFPYNYTQNQHTNSDALRIVRVPRCFSDTGLAYPEFSSLLPGNEDGAIKPDGDVDGDSDSDKLMAIDGGEFGIAGEVDGQFYGCSSMSPLSLYLTNDEFKELIDEVNSKLKECYNFMSICNILEFVFGLLTLWLLEDLTGSRSKKKLQEFDEFIDEKNKVLIAKNGIEMIPLRKSGYLSLDFVIPKPH